VGVTTIQHTATGQGEVTLYLASSNIDDTEAYSKVSEVWAEAGKVSESTSDEGGLLVQTEVWRMAQGVAPSSYVKSIKTENVGGFKTISASYYMNIDDTFEYSTTVPFTIPGTVSYRTGPLGTTANGGSVINSSLDVSPPISVR
jgi:hypothetical protein